MTRRDAAVLSLSATQSGGRWGVAQDPQAGMQFFSDFQAGFRYSSEPSRFSWQLGVSSAARHQPGEFRLLGNTAGGGLSYSMRRIHLVGSQSVGYVPAFSFAPSMQGSQVPGIDTAGDLPPSAVDFAAADRPAYLLSSNVSAAVDLSRRTTLTASYGTQRTDFVNQAEPSLASWMGSVRFTEELTKFLGLRLGYTRRRAEYSTLAGNSPVDLNDADFGVDLHKALSLTLARRTTLNFSTGSTFAGAAASTLPGAITVGKQFYLTGTATLDHLIGRTGHVGVSYNRGVNLVQGFVAPVFSDSVSATAAGSLSPRVLLSMSAAAMLGAVGQSGPENRYYSYTAAVRLSYGVSRNGVLFTDYLFNQYEIGDSVQQISTVPRNQSRLSGRVGFSMRVPVIRQWVHPRGGERQ